MRARFPAGLTLLIGLLPPLTLNTGCADLCAGFPALCELFGIPSDPNDPGNGNSNDNGNDNNDDDENTPPDADAGADREVTRGAAVTLDGTRSSDPDGDDLTYLWTQIDGPAVELNNADAAVANFTAPGSAAQLSFRLRVEDGAAADSDTVLVTVTAPAARLFVVNDTTDVVTSYSTSDLDGDVAPLTRLEPGAATSLFQPRSLAVTPDGVLFVSRQNGGLVGYDDGLATEETTPADHVVDGTDTRLDAPISLAYDAGADELYVGNISTEFGILVFANVSQAAFDGEVAPARMFNPLDRRPSDTLDMTIDALWLDSAGNLWVSDTSGLNVNSSRVLVFADAASASGGVEPLRELTGPWGNIEDLLIDAAGRLLIVDGSDTVYVFDDALSLSGAVTASRTLRVNVALASLEGIALAADGTGYVSDQSNHAVYTYADLATRSGSAAPDAELSGNATGLLGPRQMFLLEP